MSKAEIIAELANLSPRDLAEVQARIDELASDQWLDDGELSETDKQALNSAIAEYEKSPGVGSTWEEVEQRIQAKIRRQ